jgi:hypothetical protein
MQPSLGGPNTSYLEQHDWLMTVSYRHYHAFRDYQDGNALPVPSPPEIYAQTRVNLFDVTMTYALTNRFSMSLELPFELGSRETYLEHEGPSPHTMTSRGVGDTRLIGNFWLLDPERHPEKNVAVAIGVKSPVGQRAAKDYSFRETGAVLRPVDPAIQPASGGWGIVFGTQGFKRLFKDTYVYFDGAYLSNPKEMNGTNSPFGDRPEITGGDIGYIVDSVPDQYVGRVGVSRPILPRKAVSASFGVRTDGVPARDLIGGSDGYRLAGYTVSVEPGVSITRGKHSLSLTVPWTVKGHGSKTVADKRTNSPFAGIVTLADSQLILTYSRRF